jgi:hypothetical protein
MSLLAHLNLTMKVVYRRMEASVSEKMQDFLSEFDRKFETNLSNYTAFLSQIQEFRELDHIKGKWPKIDPNLAHELSLIMKEPIP